MTVRTYSELMQFKTFQERFDYLRIGGARNMERFYEERRFNQKFYLSKKWRRVRNHVIVRDYGCDLGCEDRPILGILYVHHMNPITPLDLRVDSDKIYDPEFLITASFNTHEAIHYAELYIPTEFVERRPNDTCPWKEG